MKIKCNVKENQRKCNRNTELQLSNHSVYNRLLYHLTIVVQKVKWIDPEKFFIQLLNLLVSKKCKLRGK